MITEVPAWYAEVDPRLLRLWVCTPCLDDQCLWCQGITCRCACNDASPADLALADRVWRLADSIAPAREPAPGGVVIEIQEARRLVLEAEMREAYGHLGEAARNARAA